MMDCKKVREEVWDWLIDGEDHPDAQEIKGHLKQCTGCSDDRQQVECIKGVLHDLGDRAPAGLHERLHARIQQLDQEQQAPHRVQVWQRWLRPAAYLASGAAAVLIVGLMLAPDRPGTQLPGANGLIAERQYTEEDSLNAGLQDPAMEDASRLQAVSSPSLESDGN